MDPGNNHTSDASDTIHQSETKITPWEVKGKVDYNLQIKQFGTTALDGAMIKRWEKVTKMKIHRFIRRGLVFSHQDVDVLLNCIEQGIPVYIYTGRGPSSDSMHIGHLVPFKLARYLQQALNCIVIIQMSDDEKYLFKNGTGSMNLDKYRRYSYDNARDIIACGFDLEKTLIFSNLEHNAGELYQNNVMIMGSINMSTIKATFGLGETLPESVINTLTDTLKTEEAKELSDRNINKITEIKATLKKFSGKVATVGQCVWPVFQSGPAFCTSFRTILAASVLHALKTKGSSMPLNVVANLKKVLKELQTLGKIQSMMCLVPMAIDQAPYFRAARDVASVLGCPRPAVIHSEFLPGLKQAFGKMNTTGADVKTSTISLNTSPKDVAKLIKQHAFSGGKNTMEEHQMYGGDIRVDISYQYLTYFLESDKELKTIAEAYSSGTMSTDQIKKLAADVVSKVLEEHQKILKNLTDEDVKKFFSWDRVLDVGGVYHRSELILETDNLDDVYEDYGSYGINFDRTFGFRCKPVPVKKQIDA